MGRWVSSASQPQLSPKPSYRWRRQQGGFFHLEHSMDTDRKEGLKHEVKGAVKEVAGKVTANKLREAEGAIEKNVGKVQHAAGKAADNARAAVKKGR
jgi:uncharacterized protein YjbJ (UPF0337 family)